MKILKFATVCIFFVTAAYAQNWPTQYTPAGKWYAMGYTERYDHQVSSWDTLSGTDRSDEYLSDGFEVKWVYTSEADAGNAWGRPTEYRSLYVRKAASPRPITDVEKQQHIDKMEVEKVQKEIQLLDLENNFTGCEETEHSYIKGVETYGKLKLFYADEKQKKIAHSEELKKEIKFMSECISNKKTNKAILNCLTKEDKK